MDLPFSCRAATAPGFSIDGTGDKKTTAAVRSLRPNERHLRATLILPCAGFDQDG
jgi:hypothetical protein